ncbi:MAG: hypothetical protein PF572_00265 [Patescibacteria group bacterium]|jgi:predicted transcriptional regulator of viral defense system|nr:hypothetical protein [Patescibacteria group bacterium]
MSTVKNNTFQSRLSDLANFKQKTFHIDDFARIWGIKNKNTLHTTLKRYTQKGLIHRVYRGFYVFGDIKNLDPIHLGISAIHGYAYLSTESVLVRVGVVLQKVNYITLVSNKSMKFQIGENDYYCRQLKDSFLFNKIGINIKDNINIASPERAAADLLHFNNNYYFDNPDVLDWKEINNIQINLNYKQNDFIK